MSIDFKNGTGALKLTLLRCFLAPLFMFFYINPPLYFNGDGASVYILPVYSKVFALIILILAILTDYFDGKIARKYNQVSDLGKILDPFCDAIFFVVLYTTIACVPPYWMSFWLVLPILIREIIQHTLIRTYALKNGIALAAKLSGKFKTALSCFGALYVLVIDLIATSTETITSFMRVSAHIVLITVSLVYLLSLVDYILEVKKIKKNSSLKQKF